MRHRLLAPLLALALALAACADTPPADEPTAAPPRATAARPAPTTVPEEEEPASEGSWLVMLYGDADDEVLEQDIFTDLNEAELVGSSERVTIVAQLDRYEGAFEGDGDWTDAARFLITRDDDLEALGSEVVEELGEVNMADGQTLVDFVTWAVASYPAERYALIMSDHGMGWPGGWNDPDPAEPGPDGLALTADGDMLLLDELEAALGQIREETGVEQLDLIGFDACLMAHLEVAVAVAPHARYMVASQEVEPALGWAYASFLEELTADPAMDGGELGRAIVKSYIARDTRIVDDEARAEFVEENYEGGDPSAAQVVEDFSVDITLGAYDLGELPGLLGAFDGFVEALSAVDQDLVAEARTYAQSFENVFDPDAQPSYLDLGHFAEIVAEESEDEALAEASGALLESLDTVVLAERSGEERPGATGLSIYFPDSGLYESELAGEAAYTTVAASFSEATRWDDFLALHYYGTVLGASPEAGAEVSAPGAGEISVAEIALSEEEINVADTTVLATEVAGDRIGFIYSFTGYYNPDEDSILVSDMDYIDAGESRKVGGVFYPDWGDEGVVAIEYEWAPVVYGIDDGEGVKFALLMPEDYGATDEAATYVVEGRYSFARGGERFARLYFKDGELLKAVGFTGTSGAGAPRVITPREGDQFTIVHQVIKLYSDEPDREVEYVEEDGETITYGEAGWSVAELTAPAGDYVLGVQAEDMDGNLYEAYTTVTVNE
jgi:hypothetical protein